MYINLKPTSISSILLGALLSDLFPTPKNPVELLAVLKKVRTLPLLSQVIAIPSSLLLAVLKVNLFTAVLVPIFKPENLGIFETPNSKLSLALEADVAPVPPFESVIVSAFHVPDVIVPTPARLLNEVILL